MIPNEVEPSLNSAQPEPPLLDDGFSAPRSPADQHDQANAPCASSLEEALASKSDF